MQEPAGLRKQNKLIVEPPFKANPGIFFEPKFGENLYIHSDGEFFAILRVFGHLDSKMAISRQADGRPGLVGEMGYIASDGEKCISYPAARGFYQNPGFGPKWRFWTRPALKSTLCGDSGTLFQTPEIAV